jgi:hypothetical protein
MMHEDRRDDADCPNNLTDCPGVRPVVMVSVFMAFVISMAAVFDRAGIRFAVDRHL